MSKTVVIQVRTEFNAADLASLLIEANVLHALDGATAFVEYVDGLSNLAVKHMVSDELAYGGYRDRSCDWANTMPDSDIDRVYEAAIAKVKKAWKELA